MIVSIGSRKSGAVSEIIIVDHSVKVVVYFVSKFCVDIGNNEV